MTRENFFRDATLAICGSLDIEAALWRCLLCIRERMPADLMSLHLYEPDKGVLETVAYATPEGGEKCLFTNLLPRKVREEVRKRRAARVWLVDNLAVYDGTREAAENICDAKNTTGIIMDLILEKKLMGVLLVAGKGPGCFSQDHLDLISSLNEPFAVALTNSMRYRELERLKELLADDNRYFQNELRRRAGHDVIGADTGLRNTMELVRQIAPLESPVLLTGETGVGKEVIAGAIHNFSGRAENPMLTVNCGAIPPSLMDSELFGYEKGAFTGANTRKRGIFERAMGGTVFLDEIGELMPDAQVRLLRVLEQKEIQRLGGGKKIQLNIRVIAATHRNLEKMIATGKFREDLFFRLNVFPIHIAPLRDRTEDIPALVQQFISKKSIEMKRRRTPQLKPGELERLMAYSWPGNIRQLENVVERALILNKGEFLSFEDLHSGSTIKTSAYDNRDPKDRITSLDDVVSKHIQSTLEITSGKIHGKNGAAQLLGINPSTLRHRMKKLGIVAQKTFYSKTK